MNDRILLSPPHLGAEEREQLAEALDSNWIAPLGPNVDAFEAELAETCRVAAAAATASGTAALHLALRLLGIGEGDEVLCPTLTVVASANPATYLGATPVFVDVDPHTWTVDPDLVEDELKRNHDAGGRIAAVVAVDLFGQCADYERLEEVCRRFSVPLIEDAAEALGASAYGRPAGSFGDAAILSFNGNKIITTSGGGALVSRDEELIAKARYLAAQAREPVSHYEHVQVGYNYRLSNLLAAVGRAQLRKLNDRVERRRRIYGRYVEGLAEIAGVTFMAEAEYGRSTRWLTTLTIDPEAAGGVTAEDLVFALEQNRVEARRVWKPMHMQPVFERAKLIGSGRVAEHLFSQGLCLPSGSSLSEDEQDRVIGVIRERLAG